MPERKKYHMGGTPLTLPALREALERIGIGLEAAERAIAQGDGQGEPKDWLSEIPNTSGKTITVGTLLGAANGRLSCATGATKKAREQWLMIVGYPSPDTLFNHFEDWLGNLDMPKIFIGDNWDGFVTESGVELTMSYERFEDVPDDLLYESVGAILILACEDDIGGAFGYALDRSNLTTRSRLSTFVKTHGGGLFVDFGGGDFDGAGTAPEYNWVPYGSAPIVAEQGSPHRFVVRADFADPGHALVQDLGLSVDYIRYSYGSNPGETEIWGASYGAGGPIGLGAGRADQAFTAYAGLTPIFTDGRHRIGAGAETAGDGAPVMVAGKLTKGRVVYSNMAIPNQFEPDNDDPGGLGLACAQALMGNIIDWIMRAKLDPIDQGANARDGVGGRVLCVAASNAAPGRNVKVHIAPNHLIPVRFEKGITPAFGDPVYASAAEPGAATNTLAGIAKESFAQTIGWAAGKSDPETGLPLCGFQNILKVTA